jgi:hypothetical protein
MTTIAIYDPDSLEQHPQIKALADAFVQNFNELSELLEI